MSDTKDKLGNLHCQYCDNDTRCPGLDDEDKADLTRRMEQEKLEARISELNKLAYHQATTLNGLDDVQLTLDYMASRVNSLQAALKKGES